MVEDAYISVLRAVRQQLRLRGTSNDGSNAANAGRWSWEQWWQSFNFLFIPHDSSSNEAPGSASRWHLRNHDDLLFFVHAQHPLPRPPSFGRRPGQEQQQQAPTLDPGMPFSVRRSSQRLGPEWGPGGCNFGAVAWDDTLLLNLVLQTEYSLTAVVCRQSVLPQVAGGQAASCSEATVVTKRVFASPVHTSVNLHAPDSRAGISSSPCYPDVCFAVENFEDAFTELVLTDKDDCYCVIMHAHVPERPGAEVDGSGRGPGQASISGAGDSSTGSSSGVAAPSGAGSSSAAAVVRPSRLAIFSGYVVYMQIADHIRSQGSRSAASAGKDRVFMAGPGGVGRAEVAVHKTPRGAQAASASGGGDFVQPPPPRSGLRAALNALASMLLDDGSGRGSGAADAGGKLQCAIMSMRLPVLELAANILQPLG